MYTYYQQVGYREPEALAWLRLKTRELGAEACMQVSPEEAALLALLVRLTGARRILELGTFTGYSALAMAFALPEDGILITCEKVARYSDLARDAWVRAGVASRVEQRMEPALETLAALRAEGREPFDICFIDADKKSYLEYYESCVTLTRPGGLIVIDNTLWNDALIDGLDQRPSTVAIRELNTTIVADLRVEHVLLPFGDGLTVCLRRRARPLDSR